MIKKIQRMRTRGEIFPIDADDDAYDWDEVEDGGIAPQVVRDVKTPTAQEVDEHNCTHIPSQAWCPACVAGKKPNSPHKRKTEGGAPCARYRVRLRLPQGFR